MVVAPICRESVLAVGPNPAFNTDAPWAALRARQRVAG